MKRIYLIIIAIVLAGLPITSASSATGPIFFPKGPYDSEVLSVDILKSDAADFAAITLSDGTIRGYIPNVVAQQIWIFDSKDDGKTFSKVGFADFGSENVDNFLGQPRVVLLNDGRYHLYTNGPQGISCFSSADGFKFVIDKLLCIPNNSIPTPPYYKSYRLSGPAITILSNGNYRMYFGDEGVQNDNRFPLHQIFSAISKDGTNWTMEPGARIGFTAKGLKSTAIHPEAIQHSDGSVTLFYRSYIPQNQMYASSKDGLNFSDEYILWMSNPDPVVGNGNEGGDPSLVLDRNGNMVLFLSTYGTAEKDRGGISVFRLKVGKGTKFGEEIGRNLNWSGLIQNRYLNCVSNTKPNDPEYGRISTLASGPTDMQCPDDYTIDKANPDKTVNGPTYAKKVLCKWSGSGAAPNNLQEVYFSGTSCPASSWTITNPGNSNNQSMNNSGNQGAPSGKSGKTVCYAKKGMIVEQPTFTFDQSNFSCPMGYTTTKVTAPQTKITCKALPGVKVNQSTMVLVGIGVTPKCPPGYKKK